MRVAGSGEDMVYSKYAKLRVIDDGGGSDGRPRETSEVGYEWQRYCVSIYISPARV